MTRSAHSQVDESRQSLWALTVPPCIWVAYFLLSYIVAALWCGSAGRGGSLGPLVIGFGSITLIALIAIGASGRQGWRRYKHDSHNSDAVPSHHRDSPEDRHRFLGLATVLLAALSAIATVYVALAVAVIRTCS
jgi:hypothetical protein